MYCARRIVQDVVGLGCAAWGLMADIGRSQSTYCQGIWVEGEEHTIEERLMKPEELAERLGTSAEGRDVRVLETDH
jgi:hypothetical protein